MSFVHRGVYAGRDASGELGQALCKAGDVENQKDRQQGMDRSNSEQAPLVPTGHREG